MCRHWLCKQYSTYLEISLDFEDYYGFNLAPLLIWHIYGKPPVFVRSELRSSLPHTFPVPVPMPMLTSDSKNCKFVHPEKSETPKKKVESSHVPPCPNLVHTKQEPTRIQQLQCTCQERSLLWQCQWVCYEGGDSSKHNWNYIDFSSVEPPVWSCQWAPARNACQWCPCSR